MEHEYVRENKHVQLEVVLATAEHELLRTPDSATSSASVRKTDSITVNVRW